MTDTKGKNGRGAGGRFAKGNKIAPGRQSGLSRLHEDMLKAGVGEDQRVALLRLWHDSAKKGDSRALEGMLRAFYGKKALDGPPAIVVELGDVDYRDPESIAMAHKSIGVHLAAGTIEADRAEALSSHLAKAADVAASLLVGDRLDTLEKLVGERESENEV
ncbi:MAG: hypothetical protein ACF8XB_08830 [Planctomycetota bacterium JB042]